MSRAPFRHSPETSKLPLMVVLDCQALWHPPDIAPTPASTEEQSSVEMSDLRVSPPPLTPHFPFLPQLCAVLSPSQVWCRHRSWCHLRVGGSPTSSLVRAGYGTAPGVGSHAPAVGCSPACIPVLTAVWASLTALVSCRNSMNYSGLEKSDLFIYLLERWTGTREISSVTKCSSCFEQVIRAGFFLKHTAMLQLFCCLKRMTVRPQ